MFRKILLILILGALVTLSALPQKQKGWHKFSLGTSEFLLDGNPFQIISGELHPARIPAEYWRHRIQMVKAMGCNTIAAYIFWNYHEPSEGVFDFKEGNHNLGEFFKIAAEENMWVLVRPGPYVCAEWELGGIPPYLLRIPDIKLRCLDPRYMAAAERYMAKLAAELKPWLVTSGGPILMLQIENEYGSYSDDRNYLLALKEIWLKNGIDVPFYTADGPTEKMLKAGTLPGCAVGLDSGRSQADFDLASKINPGVPVFSSETYPGWLTHWGENWARPDTAGLMKELKFLLENKKSFNLYVAHGGTNFGFTAGANSGGTGYEPDVTSYDYDAPINEQGMPTAKFMAIRRLIGSYLPKGKKLPSVPGSVKSIEIPEIPLSIFTSVWDNLPKPVNSVQPGTFELHNQDYGFILYRTELGGFRSGTLKVSELHDYATVFLNGAYIGSLDRRAGINSLELPESKTEKPVLEILTEAMGRINFGDRIVDRKGITDKVTLNGAEVQNWKIYKLPMDDQYMYDLRSSSRNQGKRGIFFRCNFFIEKKGDTYFDMSNFKKGILWVNGHNLGRYWEIGPQKRLYCPGIWLNDGSNEMIVFDLLQPAPAIVLGFKTIE